MLTLIPQNGEYIVGEVQFQKIYMLIRFKYNKIESTRRKKENVLTYGEYDCEMWTCL